MLGSRVILAVTSPSCEHAWRVTVLSQNQCKRIVLSPASDASKVCASAQRDTAQHSAAAR